jgi:hypothetical protein
MHSNDDLKLPLSERRRAIYQRAVDKHRARGTPIDLDPLFVSLMAEWIEGRIDMSEVAARSSPRGRSAKLQTARESKAVNDDFMTNDQLLSELDSIIGIHELPPTSET